MSSINYGVNLIYGGVSSERYGVFMADFNGAVPDSNDEESELITSTNAYKDTWDLHGVAKSNPLSFPITLVKNGGDNNFFNATDEREIKKWLIKKKYDWLQVDQDDLNDTFYYGLFTFSAKNNVARMTGGLTFDFHSNSTHAWSGLKKKHYSTIDGSLNFSFYSNVDFDDYIIYPTIIITPTVNGVISIRNNTTNETVTLTDCVTTEVITLECGNDKIKSSSGRGMIDSWNKRTLGIIEGANSFTLTGNFNMTLEYRLPIRVGG